MVSYGHLQHGNDANRKTPHGTTSKVVIYPCPQANLNSKGDHWATSNGEKDSGTQTAITSHSSPGMISEGGHTRPNNIFTSSSKKSTTSKSFPYHPRWNQAHITRRKPIWWNPMSGSIGTLVKHKFKDTPKPWLNGTPCGNNYTNGYQGLHILIIHYSAPNKIGLGNH